MGGQVYYDSDSDILYVELNPLEVARSVSLDDLRVIDYSEDQRVIGIEFIGASGGVDLRDLPFMHTVEQLIGESGHTFPIYA